MISVAFFALNAIPHHQVFEEFNNNIVKFY